MKWENGATGTINLAGGLGPAVPLGEYRRLEEKIKQLEGRTDDLAWDNDYNTVTKARSALLDTELLSEGHQCPVCLQYAKAYRRKISATIARLFIESFREFGFNPFRPIDEFGKNSPDFVKLRHWGLLEEIDPEARRPDGSRRTGEWRVTPPGSAFIKDQFTMSKYAVIYNNEFLRFEGEPVSIIDCLGENFDYEELMGRK